MAVLTPNLHDFLEKCADRMFVDSSLFEAMQMTTVHSRGQKFPTARIALKVLIA